MTIETLRSLHAAATAPAWAMKPREPTEEMHAAANREWDGRMSARSAGVWQAMFDAAPTAIEPVLPCELVVGAGHFHKGVRVSTAQGCIDRMHAELRRLQETYEPLSDEAKNMFKSFRSATPSPEFNLREHLQRQRDWSCATFGPGERSQGVVDHIRKELCEIEASPLDLTEWIDVTILALDGAWRAGYSPTEIIAALVAKQIKNENRQWPDWRTAEPGKAIEHVKNHKNSGASANADNFVDWLSTYKPAGSDFHTGDMAAAWYAGRRLVKSVGDVMDESARKCKHLEPPFPNEYPQVVLSSADAGTPETDAEEIYSEQIFQRLYPSVKVKPVRAILARKLERERNALRAENTELRLAHASDLISTARVPALRTELDKATFERDQSRSVTKLFYETIKKLQAELEAARRENAELKRNPNMNSEYLVRTETHVIGLEKELAALRKSIEASGAELPKAFGIFVGVRSDPPKTLEFFGYMHGTKVPEHKSELFTKDQVVAQLAAKNEQIAALTVDAERYRVLRDFPHSQETVSACILKSPGYLVGKSLDEAIDAARSKA